MPRRLLPTALLLALLLTGCGEDPPSHGLERETLPNEPTGGLIEVRYDAQDGAVFVARIDIAMRYRQRRTGGGRPQEQSGEGKAVVEVRQTFARPDPKRAPRSHIVFRYVEAKGTDDESAYLGREPVLGSLSHDADGRPQPYSLTLTGGTKKEQIEVRDLLTALMLAGFGGSPSWIPPRGIRRGEAWQLEGFLTPRALETVALQAKRSGVAVPKPTFSGTARLEGLRSGPDGQAVEVSIDALLELEGPIRKDGETGHMAIGDRVRGRAVISVTTGLPVSFRITHSNRQRVQAGGQDIEKEFTSEIEGRVERLKGE